MTMKQYGGGETRQFVARVVPPDRLVEERAIARLFRAVGIMREAFSDLAQAQAWESEQAALWQHEPPSLPTQSD